MARVARAFTAHGAVNVDAVAAALEPKFTTAVGPERTTSSTWLDTFDWRLHDAGISLEYLDGGPLTVYLPEGARLQSPLTRAQWPALVDDLPAGRLRDTLTPLVRPRALMPVVTVRRTVRENRVLNTDAKTVARLVIQHGDHGTCLLQVQPLRGYDADADRIARLLARVEGVAASATTPYDDALAHADRTPGDYDTGPTVPLRPDMPAAVAVARVLQHFAAAIEDNVAGTIDAIDVEFLHDLRVAVRRTRSILKLTGDVLPGGLAVRYQPQFKWLGDLTTPVRDLDVYLLGFDRMAAGLASADPRDLDAFRTFLLRHRTAERRRLVRGLRSKRFERLMDGWRSALADVTDGSALTVAELAEQRIGQVFGKVVKRGAGIAADSPSEDIHSLRKRCKELRYLLEVFGPLHADEPYRPMIKELKALQDTLGDFQDDEVQREAVREFAAAMMDEGTAPPKTVLAMGELAAQLDTHQLRARESLVHRLQPLLTANIRPGGKASVRR